MKLENLIIRAYLNFFKIETNFI